MDNTSERKGKEMKSIYIAPFWPRRYTQSAEAWITQFYLQITPCLPFLRERSPDGTTTATYMARFCRTPRTCWVCY